MTEAVRSRRIPTNSTCLQNNRTKNDSDDEVKRIFFLYEKMGKMGV